MTDWNAVRDADRWLDGDVAQPYKDQPLAQDWARVCKTVEEIGEAVTALIGYTGQNCRKGLQFSEDEMLGELADVVVTATLAIQHFTKDENATKWVIRTSFAKLASRVPEAYRSPRIDTATLPEWDADYPRTDGWGHSDKHPEWCKCARLCGGDQ
jgi:hypothetical protein